MPGATTPVLAVGNVVKEFSGVRVLDSVSVDIFPGEIFAVVGENGAGKSTLMKIIGGIYTPTSGTVRIADRPVEEFSPETARALGVTMIPQEFNLVGDLAVFENIFLGQERRRATGLLDKAWMIEKADALLARLNSQHVDARARVDTLSPAQKQMVEIAKALANENSRVIIMDEPTTVLNPAEVDILFGVMRDLKSRGVSVLYISHKLREVKAISDRVMILRDGELIRIEKTENMTEVQMASGMVGRELTQVFPPKAAPGDEIALRVSGLSAAGLLRDISFDVRKGEVFGLAGLMGAGRT
jgi:ribose transport system ATP-binding protein